MLSSLKVEDDEDGRILESSLKFSTLSSVRPNCLLIRLVRGVIFRGKEFLGLFDTNRLAYQNFLRTNKKDNKNRDDPLCSRCCSHCGSRLHSMYHRYLDLDQDRMTLPMTSFAFVNVDL